MNIMFIMTFSFLLPQITRQLHIHRPIKRACHCPVKAVRSNPVVVAMAKNTTNILKQLRAVMLDVKVTKQPLQAYIIPTDDAHQSEYAADCDGRRAYVSGFTGSAGTAVVTTDSAHLWTDGRYYLQASKEMDSNWELMKEGLPTTPTIGVWLAKNLPPNSVVGADGNVLSLRAWKPIQTELESAGHTFVNIPENLVDLIWTDRPARTSNPLLPLEIQYTGKTINEKLQDIRSKMVEKRASILTVCALDEIAWLLNVRGSDIPYNPVFFAYVAITLEHLYLFIDSKKITEDVLNHFKKENTNVQLKPYEEFHNFLNGYSHVSLQSKAWVSPTSGYAISDIFPEKFRVSEITPIVTMKAIKNPTEIKGMENAHIKDGAALACFFSWLEKQVAAGVFVTETSVCDKLVEFRSMQDDFMGPSFATISAVGPHGSIIHFHPSKVGDLQITDKEFYLCDSGAQFKDGTTDVTRTMHFGTPTDFERECFTRVFKGQSQVGSMIFPYKILGNSLDCFARKFLWDLGLDYGHGTGHGIGCFLNVHEGPMGITWKCMPDDPGLQEGMFLSNEPGYYESDKFGIRIEDIVNVVKADTPFNHNNRGFLKFKTVTLAPIQTKLLVREMLTEKEINNLNDYHKRVREVIGDLLLKQGQTEAHAWLLRETEPI